MYFWWGFLGYKTFEISKRHTLTSIVRYHLIVCGPKINKIYAFYSGTGTTVSFYPWLPQRLGPGISDPGPQWASVAL